MQPFITMYFAWFFYGLWWAGFAQFISLVTDSQITAVLILIIAPSIEYMVRPALGEASFSCIRSCCRLFGAGSWFVHGRRGGRLLLSRVVSIVLWSWRLAVGKAGCIQVRPSLAIMTRHRAVISQ